MAPPKKFSPENVMVPRLISDTNRPVRPSWLYFMGNSVFDSADAAGTKPQDRAKGGQRQTVPDPHAAAQHRAFQRPMDDVSALQRKEDTEQHQQRAHYCAAAFHRRSSGRGMNSSSTPGIFPNKPALHSDFATSMRFFEDETKFHHIWRGPSSGAPPNSITRLGASANKVTISPGSRNSMAPVPWASTPRSP